MGEGEGKEVVLDLGTEGGGATIYRTRLGLSGWLFHFEGTSMDLDENDQEIWRDWRKPPVASLEEALRSVTEDDSWACFSPIAVHPEYQNKVWELLQDALRNVRERSENKDSWIWDHRLRQWREKCQQER